MFSRVMRLWRPCERAGPDELRPARRVPRRGSRPDGPLRTSRSQDQSAGSPRSEGPGRNPRTLVRLGRSIANARFAAQRGTPTYLVHDRDRPVPRARLVAGLRTHRVSILRGGSCSQQTMISASMLRLIDCCSPVHLRTTRQPMSRSPLALPSVAIGRKLPCTAFF